MTDLAQLELRIRSLEVAEATRRLNELSAASKKAETASDSLARTTTKTTKTQADLETTTDKLVNKLGDLVKIYVSFRTAQTVVKSLTDIESGMVQVQKTTDLAGTELQDMEKRLEAFSSRVQTPITRVLELAAAAGQLGVTGGANISKFAESLAKLEQAAPSLAGEEAALALARLLNLTGEGFDTIDKLASVIARLDRETAAYGQEITHTATFVGAAVAQFKISSAEVAAISAAVREVGQQAEIAGTTLGRTFNAMDKAVADGGDSLQQFAEISGLTSEAFAKLFEASPVDAFNEFIKGVGRLIDAGENLDRVLKTVGLGGRQESQRVIGALASNSDLLGKDLARVRDEIDKTVTLEKVFKLSNDTLRASFGALSNSGTILIDNILDDKTGIAGGLRAIVDAGGAAIRIVAGIGSESEKASIAAEALAFAIRALTIALIAFGTVSAVVFISKLTIGFIATAGAIIGLIPAVNSLAAALALLQLVSPVGWIAALATVIGVTVGAILTFGDSADDAAKSMENLAIKTDAVADATKQLIAGQQLEDESEWEMDNKKRIAGLNLQLSALQKLREEAANHSVVPDAAFFDPDVMLKSFGEIDDKVANFDRMIASVKRDLEGLQGPPPKILTGEESEARDDLEKLQKKLELERELIMLTSEEADVQRQLIEVKDLIDKGNFTEKEKAERESIIETLIREIAAQTELTKAKEEAKKASDEATKSLIEYIKGLQEETKLAGLSADQKEIEQAVSEGLAIARKKEGEDLVAIEAFIRKEVAARQALTKALANEEEIRKALTDLKTSAKELDESFESFFRTARDNRIATGMKKITEEANNLNKLFMERRKLGIISDEELATARAGIEKFVDQSKAKLEELEDLRVIHEIASGISTAFGDAAKSIIDDWNSMSDALDDLIQGIQDAIVNALVIDPLVDQLTAFLTSIGSDIFGIDKNVSEMETASMTAMANLAAGGQAAAAAMIAGAQTSASILASAQGNTPGTAKSLGGLGGATPGITGNDPAASDTGGSFLDTLTAALPALFSAFGSGGYAEHPQLAMVGETGRERILNPQETREYDQAQQRGSMANPTLVKSNNATTNITVIAKDADSFRSTQRQIVNQQNRLMARR